MPAMMRTVLTEQLENDVSWHKWQWDTLEMAFGDHTGKCTTFQKIEMLSAEQRKAVAAVLDQIAANMRRDWEAETHAEWERWGPFPYDAPLALAGQLRGDP